MNKIFRLVWSELNRTWVAVSEITRGRGKRASGVVGYLVGYSDEGTASVAIDAVRKLTASYGPEFA